MGKYSDTPETCTHLRTQFFRVPGGVKELCTCPGCWANVRGRKRLVPSAEARRLPEPLHVLGTGQQYGAA